MILFILLDDNSSNSGYFLFLGLLILLILIVLIVNYQLRQRNKFLANDKTRLEKEIQNLKLDISKYRLDPHLFRNSLNSISSFANTTSFGIQKLISVLEYNLYESTGEYVTLEKEIEFLSDFIKLNKLRLSADYNVSINNEKLTPESRDMLIVPNVTTHFVENAFKHGEFTKSDSFIKVIFYTENNFLIFQVDNTIGKNNQNGQGGIGKNYFKQRLDIQYPDGIYELNYSENNGIHTAFLKIPLYAAKT